MIQEASKVKPHKTKLPDVAGHVYDLRVERGWNQTDLARHSGLSRATVNGLEREHISANLETLSKLAAAFGVPVARLVSEEDPLGQEPPLPASASEAEGRSERHSHGSP